MVGVTMYNIGKVGSEAAIVPVAGGIRVVSFDPDAEVHSRLRSAIAGEPDFVLMGEGRDWNECEALLDQFVPELLVANVTRLPARFLEDLSPLGFPVLLGSQAIDRELVGTKPYGIFPMSSAPEPAHDLLDRVRCEICRRKAAELSTLLLHYMVSATKCGQYLATLNVEVQGHAEVIDLDRIVSFTADGNYIRVHTHDRAFEIRETMIGIFAKLDPTRFTRVHRSFIINLSQIRNVVARDGCTTSVILSNGMEVPVGPNYRDEFSSITQVRNRLIA
jgi:two-component system LytT family response regulator